LPTLIPGQDLSHYRVLSPLGAGGMGEVYLAEDQRLGRKVALKILSRALVGNHDRVRRFWQEARTVSALNHPNILTVYDVGQVGDVHFIATEYVDGETLRQRLDTRQIGAAEALGIAIQIARALSAAHAAGIVHRDLKPENVMLRRDGYTKVLDFGLAKLRDSSGMPASAPDTPTEVLVETTPGVIMGTFKYMSPEQARGRQVDGRSDLFSLGVMLYEMLCGQVPFGGDTAADVLARLIHHDPAGVSTIGPAPRALDPIVARLLRKLPEDRYQIADDLVADLKAVEKDVEPARGAGAVEPARSGEPSTSAEGSEPPRDKGRSRAAGSGPKRRPRRSVDSIAVLPLENLSRDETLDYLTDGLTESLINSLSQLPRIRVMARSTVFRYKSRELDPQQIGEDLGVRAVLTGRVLQRDDSLMIGAELVDVADGSQLWGAQFSRRLSDIFSIQEEIAREITDHLRLRLTPAERQRLVRGPKVSATAYELYLKGRYYLSQRSPNAIEKARDHFEQAIVAEPGYAQAHAGLADSHAITAATFGEVGREHTIRQARAAATRALELDEAIAEAHSSLAFIRFRFDWDWTGAEFEFRRALDLNPNHAQARHWFAMYLASRRRLDHALEEMLRAREVDPLSPIVLSGLSRIHHFAGRYRVAIESFRQVLKADPRFVGAHFGLALTFLATGEACQAEAQADSVAELLPNSSLATLLRAGAALVEGRRADVEHALAMLTSRYDANLTSADDLAIVSSWLGDDDVTVRWLRKACDERGPSLAFVEVEPMLAPLARSPRCRELLRQHNLVTEP
jgi:serine/threonine-protein kinase